MTSNRDAALSVLEALRGAGHVAYFAGGCVRDQLLGLAPKDYDVATSATPDEIRRMFRSTQAVGAAFGVILVRVAGLAGQGIEVATFRADGSYSDGRRPDSVRFSSPEEDARRRDFTINGLFLDPVSGEVVDFVGGRADLEARVLRAIGTADERFAEDHLRLLRAVRFAARFGLTLDPPTASAVRRHARMLRTIAPERVGDEVRRMLVAPTRQRAWTLLRELGLTPELFRFVECVERPAVELFGRVGLQGTGEVSFALALAAATLEETAERGDDGGLRDVLAQPRVVAAVRGLRQSLRLSNEESEAMTEMLNWARALLAEDSPRLATKRRFLARPVAADGIGLLSAVRAAGLCVGRLDELLPELAELSKLDNAPLPLVTGDELVAAGLSPGPVFKRMLEVAYDAQLEGRVTDRATAMALAMSVR